MGCVAHVLNRLKYMEAMTHHDSFRSTATVWPAKIFPSNRAHVEWPGMRIALPSFVCRHSVTSSDVPLHWPNHGPFPVRRSHPTYIMPSQQQIELCYSNHWTQQQQKHISGGNLNRLNINRKTHFFKQFVINKWTSWRSSSSNIAPK